MADPSRGTGGVGGSTGKSPQVIGRPGSSSISISPGGETTFSNTAPRIVGITAPRIVGITAPTKDDWSNEFELAEEGPGLVLPSVSETGGSSGGGGDGHGTGADNNVVDTSVSNANAVCSKGGLAGRAHSRRVIRSLDRGKLQSLNQEQYLRHSRTLGLSVGSLNDSVGSMGPSLVISSQQTTPSSQDGGSSSVSSSVVADLDEILIEQQPPLQSGKRALLSARRGNTTTNGMRMTAAGASLASIGSSDAAGRAWSNHGNSNKNVLNIRFEGEASTISGSQRTLRTSSTGDFDNSNNNTNASAHSFSSFGSGDSFKRLHRREQVAKVQLARISATLGDINDDVEGPSSNDHELDDEDIDQWLSQEEVSFDAQRMQQQFQATIQEDGTPSPGGSFNSIGSTFSRHFDVPSLGPREDNAAMLQSKRSVNQDTTDSSLLDGDITIGNIIIKDEEEEENEESDSHSSMSDWDAELEEEEETITKANAQRANSNSPSARGLDGFSFQQQLEGLRNLVDDTPERDPAGNTVAIPRRWQLAAMIREGNTLPTIVRYPKPSALYSLRTKDGMRFMQETVLERWLSNLVHDPEEDGVVPVTSSSTNGPSDRKALRATLGKAIPGSLEWVNADLSLIWGNYAMRQDAVCADATLRLFRMVGCLSNTDRSCKVTKKWHLSTLSTGETGGGTDSGIYNSSSESPRTPEKVRKERLRKQLLIDAEAEASKAALIAASLNPTMTTPTAGASTFPFTAPANSTGKLSAVPTSRLWMRPSWYNHDSMDSDTPLSLTDMQQHSTEHIEMWDSFLAPVVQGFKLGVMALARTGAQIKRDASPNLTVDGNVSSVSVTAHNLAPSSSSNSNSASSSACGGYDSTLCQEGSRGPNSCLRQTIPRSVLSLVCNLSRWVTAQVPGELQPYLETRLMLLEAEAAAHQLAMCELSISSDPSAESSAKNESKRPMPQSKASREGYSLFSTVSRNNINSKPPLSEQQQDQNLRRNDLSGWQFLHLPPESSATPFLSDEARIAEAVLAQFCRVFFRARELCEELKLNNGTVSEENLLRNLGSFAEADPLRAQAECLCDMQLVLYGMSPLTTTETNKLQDALDQLQLELEDWMTSDATVEAEVIDIVRERIQAERDTAKAKAEATNSISSASFSQQPLVDPEDAGISMCIGVVHANRHDMLECERLCGVDPRYRMACLLELYPSIPAESLLKAKAAFVLAMYVWDEHQNSEQAEEQLFECLFVLERIRDNVPQCPDLSLLSELATNAMVLYGDILVENSKYKYAIGAYESAVLSYKVREHANFHWLFRRLCSICAEHLDWDRALKYHLEILHITKLETNLNEFVYVSERVAMMLLDQRADFALAESYLKLALSYLGGHRVVSSLANENHGYGGTGGSTSNGSNMKQFYSGDGRFDGIVPQYSTGRIGAVGNSGSLIGSVDNAGLNLSTGISGNGGKRTSSDVHHQSLRLKLQQRLAHVLLAANRAEDAARLLSHVVGKVPITSNDWSSLPHDGVVAVGSSPSSHLYRMPVPSYSHLGNGGISEGTNGLFNNSSPQRKGMNEQADADSVLNSASRWAVLMLLAKSCLKLRWLADCTCALDQLANEASQGRWCDPCYAASHYRHDGNHHRGRLSPWPRPRPTRSMVHELLLSLRASIGADACMSYGLLRARCSLYQGLRDEALTWVDSVMELAGLDPCAVAPAAKHSNSAESEDSGCGEEGWDEFNGDEGDLRGNRPRLELTLGQIGCLYYTRGKFLQFSYSPSILRLVQSPDNKLNSFSSGGTDNASTRAFLCRECGFNLAPDMGNGRSNGPHGIAHTNSSSSHAGHGATGGARMAADISAGCANVDPFCTDLTRGFLEMDVNNIESQRSAGCEESVNAFLCAFEYFQLIDDALWQAKSLSRVAHVELAEYAKMFANKGSSTVSATADYDAIGTDSKEPDVAALTDTERLAMLDRIGETASTAIDLCADIGYAPLMVRCLLNMAQLNQLRGNLLMTQMYWQEARTLLNTVYLTTELSAEPSPGDLPSSARGAASSFSFAQQNINAQIEMEQALNQFMMLSKEQSFSVNQVKTGNTCSNGNKPESNAFVFPDTRVPGVHTAPGLTLRLLAHVTRLLSIAFSNNSAMATMVVTHHPDLLVTWNWLSDESWKQFSHCTKLLLSENEGCSLYNDYFLAFTPSTQMAYATNDSGSSNTTRGSNLSQSSTSSVGAESASMQQHMRDAAASFKEQYGVQPGQPQSGSPDINSTTANNNNNGSGRGHNHQRNKSDPSAMDAMSGYAMGGRRIPHGANTHQEYIGPNIVHNARHRERIKQLRQFAVNRERECKRCRISRHAELLTTEGRTDLALWSCFHRFKLLTHGEIGLSLHMGEVHASNLELLRKIRELTRPSHAAPDDRGLCSSAARAAGENVNALDVNVQQPQEVALFKAPTRYTSAEAPNSSSTPLPSSTVGASPVAALNMYCGAVSAKTNRRMPLSFLFGWHGMVVSVDLRRAFLPTSSSTSSGKSLDSETEIGNAAVAAAGGGGGGSSSADPKVPALAITPHVLVSSVQFGGLSLCDLVPECDGGINGVRAEEGRPNLLGLWECLLCLNNDELFRLVALLMVEHPVVVVASLNSTRARAIEALLALLRPMRWMHAQTRNVPAVLAYTCGKLVRGSSYIVGLHPCAVADFVKGLEDGSTAAPAAPFSRPAVINLDGKWAEFPPHSKAGPALPWSFQCILELALEGKDDHDDGISTVPTAADTGVRQAKQTQANNNGSTTTSIAVARPPHIVCAGENQGRGLVVRRRCQRLYDGVSRMFVWLMRFLPYFYDSKLGRFDAEGFCKSMRIEDPAGAFCARLTQTRMFRTFYEEGVCDTDSPQSSDMIRENPTNTNASKSLARLRLDDNIAFHLKNKATLYRSLVGLTRGCWVWMVVFDYTIERELVSAHQPDIGTSCSFQPQRSQHVAVSSVGAEPMFSKQKALGTGTAQQPQDRGEIHKRKGSLLSKVGIGSCSRQPPVFKDGSVSRVAEEIQRLQLRLLRGGDGTPQNHGSNHGLNYHQTQLSSTNIGHTDLNNSTGLVRNKGGLQETLLAAKVKKKWIYLEEKHVRYHFRKSKTREKGAISLDPVMSRLVVPARSYSQSNALDLKIVQSVLERTWKPRTEDLLEDPVAIASGGDSSGGGRAEDDHWLYLVTQLHEQNRARIMKFRFMDKLEEQVWMHALRVKFMQDELLLNLLAIAYGDTL